MSRSDYYEELKQLARQKRVEYGVKTDSLGLREVRAIYSKEGIHLDLWRHPLRKLKAAYFPNDGDPSVLVNEGLPMEPRLFAEIHELKHHFKDAGSLSNQGLSCRDYELGETSPPIEIGAEVFAAEFIFPEAEFTVWASQHVQFGGCRPEDVVRLKRVCPARVSYTFLVKRLERLQFAPQGTLGGVKYKKLEESLYGPPTYKRILAARRARVARDAVRRENLR